MSYLAFKTICLLILHVGLYYILPTSSWLDRMLFCFLWTKSMFCSICSMHVLVTCSACTDEHQQSRFNAWSNRIKTKSQLSGKDGAHLQYNSLSNWSCLSITYALKWMFRCHKRLKQKRQNLFVWIVVIDLSTTENENNIIDIDT